METKDLLKTRSRMILYWSLLKTQPESEADCVALKALIDSVKLSINNHYGDSSKFD